MLLPYVELGSEVKMSGTSIEGVAQSEGRKQPTSAKPDQDASRMHVGGHSIRDLTCELLCTLQMPSIRVHHMPERACMSAGSRSIITCPSEKVSHIPLTLYKFVR